MAILCHCEGVNDRAISAAVVAGARCVEDVSVACGAGRGCGTCHPSIVEILVAHGIDTSCAEEMAGSGSAQ